MVNTFRIVDRKLKYYIQKRFLFWWKDIEKADWLSDAFERLLDLEGNKNTTIVMTNLYRLNYNNYKEQKEKRERYHNK